MKILTWNIERLQKNKNQLIIEQLLALDADIVVLTETSTDMHLGAAYHVIKTEALAPIHDQQKYKAGENRVSIWSKFPIQKSYNTYDAYTSICAEIESSIGFLKIYATITGVFGGTNQRFKDDLDAQLLDIERLMMSGEPPAMGEEIEDYLLVNNNHKGGNIIIGDLNTTFSGRAYPSHAARDRFNEAFAKLHLKNLTAAIDNNVDHIIISEALLSKKEWSIDIWNEDKKLSDHIGICVELF